jgi:predicted phage-related endonuclease
VPRKDDSYNSIKNLLTKVMIDILLLRYFFMEDRMGTKQESTTGRHRRRYFIGGSDARIIMGNDESALLRLWREKRGEVEPEDLSANLPVQLGLATEELNRRWYEANTGHVIGDIQRRLHTPRSDGWAPP